MIVAAPVVLRALDARILEDGVEVNQLHIWMEAPAVATAAEVLNSDTEDTVDDMAKKVCISVSTGISSMVSWGVPQGWCLSKMTLWGRFGATIYGKCL